MPQQPSPTTLQRQLIDSSGNLTWEARKLFQFWQQQLSGGLDENGNLISNIEPTVEIVGRLGNLGTILQHLDQNGDIDSSGLPAASDTEQGAVKLATGSVGNTLGSAAMKPVSAFDPAGSAAAAQTAAAADATAKANAAQTNAQAYTDTQIAAAFASGLSVTITTAALTTLGTQGSMTFVNGLLTAQVQAT